MRATLIIANYNGRHLLERSIPAALTAAGMGGHEVVVADDASTDDSVEFLCRELPEAKVLALAHRGFGATCNQAVAAANTDIVVLLNSDVIVTPDFLEPLLDALSAEDVFAVGCKFANPDGSFTHALGNRVTGEWRQGLLFLHHETKPERLQERVPQLYANGGGMAFRRDKWLALGGFDSLYEPFYWEDVDLGYRAWRCGWRMLYEPEALVYHDQGSTIGKHHRPAHIETISARNAVLFTWKNLLDPGLFARALRAQVRWAADDLLIGGLPPRARALRHALSRLARAAQARAQEQRAALVPDADILQLSAGGRP
jgi:GT2 family glycosyltransferase